MQTPYPSVHFPLLLVCRPRSLEEKTRMPASPAKRSCRASSPESQRGTVCGRRPLGTLGWRGLGARIPAFGLHASVCASDELTGWPCRVCACACARVCVCVRTCTGKPRQKWEVLLQCLVGLCGHSTIVGPGLCPLHPIGCNLVCPWSWVRAG